MTEEVCREALARIAAGFYTERGAQEHAKDVIKALDITAPDPLSSNPRDDLSELEALKQDIARHVAICAEQATEIERLRNIERIVIELVTTAQDWGNNVAVSERIFTDLEAALEVNGPADETNSRYRLMEQLAQAVAAGRGIAVDALLEEVRCAVLEGAGLPVPHPLLAEKANEERS